MVQILWHKSKRFAKMSFYNLNKVKAWNLNIYKILSFTMEIKCN